MRLADVVTRFDQVDCYDAYNPASVLFKGQFDLFDDSKRDGSTVTRRIIATGPGVSLPVRRAIKTGDQFYVLGRQHSDWFQGEIIRDKYILLPVTEQANVGSELDVLSGSGTAVFASRVWLKNLKEETTASEHFPIYNIYLASVESVAVNQLVYLENHWHRVLSSFESAAGFLALEAVELAADAVTTVSFTARTGTYNAVTDSYSTGAPVVLNALIERFQTFYNYRTAGTLKPEPGDFKVTFRESEIADVKEGSVFTLNSHTYEILSAVLEDATWHAHARRKS